MAWTAKVHERDVSDKGVLAVTVEFKSGARTVYEDFRTTEPFEGWVAQAAARKIRELMAVDAVAPAIVPGPITLPTSTVPTPDPERELFAERLNELRALHNFVDLGIIDKTDNIWTSRVAWLRANRKPSYFDL